MHLPFLFCFLILYIMNIKMFKPQCPFFNCTYFLFWLLIQFRIGRQFSYWHLNMICCILYMYMYNMYDIHIYDILYMNIILIYFVFMSKICMHTCLYAMRKTISGWWLFLNIIICLTKRWASLFEASDGQQSRRCDLTDISTKEPNTAWQENGNSQ